MLECLVQGYRGDILETMHMGHIAVVDTDGKLLYSVGDPDYMNCYRSASKPIQAVPVILHGLDKKYNLTQQELAVLCASHYAEPIHVETILGILAKADFVEDDFIMKPTYPGNAKIAHELIAAGSPKRKVYHNCTGKHSGLLMLAKETDADYHDYYKLESNAQQEILDVIAEVTEWPRDKIEIGLDGCGVPVFAVPLKNAALSFAKLARPEAERDPAIANALKTLGEAMNAAPIMIRGENQMCHFINSDQNLVGKLGALAVHCVGMRKEGLGIAVKLMDGNSENLPLVIYEVLRQLGYENDTLYANLRALPEWEMYNDNGTHCGHKKPVFTLKKHF